MSWRTAVPSPFKVKESKTNSHIVTILGLLDLEDPRHYYHSKHREMLIQWHSVKFQKPGILSDITAKTSNLATAVSLDTNWHSTYWRCFLWGRNQTVEYYFDGFVIMLQFIRLSNPVASTKISVLNEAFRDILCGTQNYSTVSCHTAILCDLCTTGMRLYKIY